jgi:NAD(P)H dehydrogenase (quinone)
MAAQRLTKEPFVFVIFGATGNAGRVTATQLREAGKPVRVVVRQADQASGFAALGCEVAVADLTDRRSVERAIDGAHAVQMLCPVPSNHPDPAQAMRDMIDVAADALRANPPRHLLAISDYGAELATDTGITLLFHYLEQKLHAAAPHVTLLRSAEHMQNWARVIPVALATGVLPSFHHPLTKPFPTVSARDVGAAAAALLLEGPPVSASRVVSIEGPQRTWALDVARTLSEAAGREIAARELPRDQWTATLLRAGLTERHAQLITDLYDTHNAGHIDVEANAGERRFGTTPLADVFATIVARVAAPAR